MLGYAQVGIPYARDARKAGVTKFRFGALLRLAIDGITSQSTKPLHLITLFGFGFSLICIAATVFYLLLWAAGQVDPPPGFMTLVMLMLVSMGINSMFLGILGEYLGRVFQNVRNMPLTIIEERIGSPIPVKPTTANHGAEWENRP